MPDDPTASPSPDRTRELGEKLGAVLRPGDVIGLSGDLGVGKTCFAQGIAVGLGVDRSVPVTSPTFVLVGEYPGRLALRHADFYRVESYARLDDDGFDDLLDGRGVVVVEWPERFPAALPDDRLEIRIEMVSEHERRISATGRGEGGKELARRLRQAWR